jgi:hypothetical protein
MFSWSAFYLGLFSFYPIKRPLIRGNLCDLTVFFFSIWPVYRSKFLNLNYYYYYYYYYAYSKYNSVPRSCFAEDQLIIFLAII